MNRTELQKLSKIRIKEAKALLDKGLYDGAYYLCGYAVECALKACIAKNVKQYDFPDKKVVNDSYTHDLVKLIRTAGLDSELDTEANKSLKFRANWRVVKDWSEDSRYTKNSKAEAHNLYKAITSQKNGVFLWIETHW